MKSAVVAYLLWCLVFLGFAGIHRFYAGKWVTGLIWLLTGGLFLFGQVIDLILIPGMIREANLRTQLAAHR
jgi:TM2 domain-containing membrane protein YozV